ncbi:MAG: phosphatase [Proteobacteria bacterium]|nr:phosphatase [Pseudomonadota bacterium]
MKFTIYQDSRKGGRQYNEDRVGYSYSRDALLMVVADGMGGHLHGEVAAQIAVELVCDQFQKHAKPVLPRPAQFLNETLNMCHDAIFNYASSHRMVEIPRTTCVACLVQDGIAYWAHVGDSRLYLVRNGKTVARTRDHSKVRKMVDAGLITAEEALHHAEKNKVYTCLGGYYPPEIELGGKVALLDGDTLLLCSDGLWGVLPERDITHFLNAFPALFALPQLMDKAEMQGGHDSDNLSAIAVNWHDDDEKHGKERDFISTQKLDATTISTHISQLSTHDGPAEVTEDDIEKAIAEIQMAIRKYSK